MKARSAEATPAPRGGEKSGERPGLAAMGRASGGLRRYLSHVGAIVWKDVLSEYRSREVVTTMVVFALLVIVLFQFAFEVGERVKASVGSGVLWTAFLFSAVLGMNRTFALEKEEDCIQGLLLSPVDRGAIFLGKLIANLIFLLVVEAVGLPLFGVLYDFPLQTLWLGVGPVVLVATVGLATVGTLFAAVAVNTKAREVMLPLLLFPVAIPVVIGATGATTQVLAGASPGEVGVWYRLLFVYDVVFLIISLWLADYVLEE